MFLQIAWFEIRFWLRSWMPWIFLLVISVLTLIAVSADQISVGGAISNTYHNAPFVIESRYAFMCVIGLLMSTAFVNSAALRDFNNNTHQIIFSTPMRRRDYLLGRFFGATLISVIPMLGVSVGILLAKYMPWADPERWEAVNWTAHLNGILVFALPNTLLAASILFAVAVLARRDAISFIAALLLFMGFVVGDGLMQNIHAAQAAALLDPFGIRTLALATRYWTVAEKNTLSAGLSGVLLLNRLIWIGASCAIFAASYYRFSFAERRTKPKATESEALPTQASELALAPDLEADLAATQPMGSTGPASSALSSAWSSAAKLLGSVKIHFLGMAKSNFIIVIGVAILLDIILLIAAPDEAYGNHSFPVTYKVIDLIREDMYFFVLVVITYYSGVLVWKDRDERVDEIADATPTPEWISYAARLVTLLAMVVVIQFVSILSGIGIQAIQGYHRFQIGLYLNELIVRDGSSYLFVAVLAVFIQTLSPNKYIGYFILVAFLVTNAFVWRPLNVVTYLVQFGKADNVLYSDFFGEAPYRTAWNWFTLYWLLFCAMLAIGTVMLWPRGKQDRWKARARNAALRFGPPWKAATAMLLLAFTVCGAWIWYNTKVLNTLLGPKDVERIQADYEKTYKPYDKLPQPRVRSVKYAVDIFPSTRNIKLRGEEVIYNPYSHPLDEVHFSCSTPTDPILFSVPPRYDTSIEIPGAELVKDDQRLAYRIYRFSTPIQPGEERTIRFTVNSTTRGFENDVTNPEIVQNGTFIDNFFAVIGYDSLAELSDPVERKKFGLQGVDLMPALERNCTEDCGETVLPGHSDWVDMTTVISTTPDQIAVAPGSLVREWRQDGRRYFEYKLDHPSRDSFCFMSANYEVAREDWNGINLEVYYLKEQPWNVRRMTNSMKKSLDYYIKNFGPYPHKEARIIEFPRLASFAQEFPGTMPYSESIGFIANLTHPDDIDTVFYVVAHEMAHQWWGGQVAGAKMEGETLLTETLAQYSALMVMEKEFGRDLMRKFLMYEMDRYLRSRGEERQKERPLLTVETGQGYIHYRKGAVVLYYMKEMIGEEAVNRALRKLLHQYGYAPAPYPTSYALVDALREETPANLQYLIKDLFEDITLFSNRTLAATAVKRTDGKYDVTINVEARKFKDDAKGDETEVPVDDWIDIGAFAKPASGRLYGDTLYRERMHITRRNSTFTFVTDLQPEKAGIDPFALLIDRIPDDNMRTVTLESVPAQQAHD
jgi:ABC-2 type transport system permease protein